jgi:hypothetical protein
MTRRTALRFFVAALATSMLGGSAARADNLLIPKGTVVPVALIQDVSTATVKVGDKIKAVYTGDDEGGFPTGTVFVGTVTEASAKTSKANGMMKVAFNQAVLPDKKTISIDGSPVNASGGAPSNPTSSKSKRDAGKGAALGAAAGMAVAGNNVTGAVLGGLAGGAIGHKSGSKPQDIAFKKGTSFGIKLNQSAKVPQSGGTSPKAT